MINIFAPSPVTNPSALNSIDGAEIAFAKPVIGISEPAPACRAILSYTPVAVSSIPINIRVIEVTVFAVSSFISKLF